LVLTLQGKTVLAGSAAGPVLRLDAPISFWGGVDPKTAEIADPRHPQCGMTVAGKLLAISGTIGSSSSSSILLELIAGGRGPAALLLTALDPILLLGAIVARELGHKQLPAALISPEVLARLVTGLAGRLEADGQVVVE
jgi:uncharacterized protein